MQYVDDSRGIPIYEPAPVARCPHCGCDDGFFTKDYVRGPMYYNYNFDGTEADNGELYDSTTHIPGKWAYCSSCRKRLFMADQIKAIE